MVKMKIRIVFEFRRLVRQRAHALKAIEDGHSFWKYGKSLRWNSEPVVHRRNAKRVLAVFEFHEQEIFHHRLCAKRVEGGVEIMDRRCRLRRNENK